MTMNTPNPLMLDETGKRIADAVEQIASGTDPLFHADAEDNTKPMFGEVQLAKLTDIPITVVGDKLMFGDKEIAFVEDSAEG